MLVSKTDLSMRVQGDFGRAVRAAVPGLRRAVLFTFTCSVLALASSWYMLEVYGRVVDTRDATTLLWLTLAVLLAYALHQAQERGKFLALAEAGSAFEEALAPRAFQVGVQASLHGSGPLGAGALQDLQVMGRFLRSGFVQAFCDAPSMLVAVVLLWLIHPQLALAALGVVVVQVVAALAAERIGGRRLREGSERAAYAQLRAERFLQAAPAAHAMGAFPAFVAGWKRLHEQSLRLQAESSQALGAGYAATRFLQSSTASGLLGLSAWLLLQDSLEGGSVMLVVSAIVGSRAVAPIVQAASAWPDLITALRARQRLGALLLRHPEPEPGMPLPPPQGPLTVEQATVVTEDGVSLLRELRFTLAAGDALAVVGASGAGKTTLARLLIGALRCSRGSVRLGGVEVATWNKDQLGPHIGYLPQGVEVLEGTVSDNVARFGSHGEAAVRDALRLAGLEAWVEEQPAGLDTRVGPQGAFLSGGQRQRLALARACCGRPSFVVLDEPDAHLDDVGEASLAEAVAQLKAAGAIVVCVTHRRALVSACSHLLVLSGGTQVAFGTVAEVMAGAEDGGRTGPRRPVGVARA